MGEIISIRQQRERKFSEQPSFTDLLQQANQRLRVKNIFTDGKSVETVSPERLRRVLETQLTQVLFREKMISEPYFLCVNYASKTLADYFNKPPESLYVSDFLMNREYQKAGDLAFLLLSCFPKRQNRSYRPVAESDVADLGRQAFLRFYSVAPQKNEIGYHMYCNFDAVVGLTREALRMS